MSLVPQRRTAERSRPSAKRFRHWQTIVIASGMLGVLGLPSGVVATELDGQGGAIDESKLPMSGGNGRMASADHTLGLASRNVRSFFVRLPPATYGEGDNGFMAIAVRCARENGAAVYRRRWLEPLALRPS
jgi:hypothetical protein